MEVLIFQKEAFEEMAAKFSRFSDRVNELLAKQGGKSLNPNRSLEFLCVVRQREILYFVPNGEERLPCF